MFNITGDLNSKPEFEEVKYLKRKIKENTECAAVDNSKPRTFKLSK